ncbi:monosaccharide ABC transporter ATP-binding protein (CUT2 family) [Lentzea atacamensis]|uniref:Monosaccharide ABC transporter ATP-binding protein (CUT2 family) n=1 Tax=Lentzea atacamensis TaxID=531938 RepID=A0ABX9EAL4_9PSEU|nr:sugar ABC transporter ATP-binding protein [Lentzea atacamensis]RAS66933.1 monosaccharide ABC transporter ATP-binding protein (CUT2 family) [Lentzea atacamensis]
MTAVLSVQHLVKSFHGNRAVDDVSFQVNRGEIVALLGENGAGKSTVIKVLAGVHRKDSGAVVVDGDIAFVHQDLGLVEWMTVAENIAMATGFPRRNGFISWRAVREQAERTLELVGSGIDPDARVFDLPRTERSLLAIARALVNDPRLLVLDEPTASLPQADVERLFTVLRGLRDNGVGMIYVSHRLDEVYEIADSVVVMRDGSVVANAPTSDIPPDELVRLIVGRDTEFAAPGVLGHAVRLDLRGLCVGDVGPVDLTVRAGEVVGLVGLRGAGQDEIGRAVAGEKKPASGRMFLDGNELRPRDTAAAVAAGVGFTTSNRETDGVTSGMSVRENLFLNPEVWGRRLFSVSGTGGERAQAAALVREYGVRPADPEAPIDTLSGGNQQKVVLARWFSVGRAVTVLEEPTMGVDVGAKADIYALLRNAGQRGMGTLVVSTDLEEVAAVCHRALVFERGRVTRSLARDELTVSALVAAVSGLTDKGV